MYGIYTNIGGILMVNVTIYSSTMDPSWVLSSIQQPILSLTQLILQWKVVLWPALFIIVLQYAVRLGLFRIPDLNQDPTVCPRAQYEPYMNHIWTIRPGGRRLSSRDIDSNSATSGSRYFASRFWSASSTDAWSTTRWFKKNDPAYVILSMP